MCWFRKYQQEAHWLDWYRREFDARHRTTFDDPEDARATAIYRMIYEKLPAAAPKHRDRLDAYVRGMYRNLLTDMVRERAGRPRPPAKMAALGEPIAGIFHKFCLERKPVDVIAAESGLSRLSVRGWVTWLKANRKCPERTVMLSMSGVGGDDTMREAEFPAAGPDDPIGAEAEDEEMQGIGEWLLELAGAADAGARVGRTGPSGAVRRRLAGMRAAVSALLTDEDRLLIALRYGEELELKAVSAAMKLPVHTVRRREKALLARLRELFAAYGLEG